VGSFINKVNNSLPVKMSKKLEVVSTKIPPKVYKDMMEEVDSGDYVNKADFLRQVIREKIEKGE